MRKDLFSGPQMLAIMISVLFALVLIGLIYGLGMPTTRRMDAIMLGSFAISSVVLVFTYVFPRAYWLTIIVAIYWLLTAIAALAAVFITIWALMWKQPFPFIGQQWYGVAMAMGIIGAFLSVFSYASYVDAWMWVQNHTPRPESKPVDTEQVLA